MPWLDRTGGPPELESARSAREADTSGPIPRNIELVVSALDACGNTAQCAASVCGDGDDDDFGESLRFMEAGDHHHRLSWHAKPHVAGYRLHRQGCDRRTASLQPRVGPRGTRFRQRSGSLFVGEHPHRPALYETC